ncbi:PREDICTED: uncharacterized protein LOC106313608 isoform X2 [Brassica oleracea var. oleracea]|uniref:uncharacterized protein LOC106313608 isoform X2 n=1 Tax=Brassica oleracea var. oleracea TaxID=109376 RepID=UPI0006A6C41A|nr:PREDICTED: uncharacterized protein LOC106313608 isoform X2 [Brassica oleracea var. oleracea]
MHSFNGITTYLTPKTQFNHDYLFNAFDLYSRRWISNYKKIQVGGSPIKGRVVLEKCLWDGVLVVVMNLLQKLAFWRQVHSRCRSKSHHPCWERPETMKEKRPIKIVQILQRLRLLQRLLHPWLQSIWCSRVWERATMAALSPQKLKISVVFSGGQALITLSNMDYSITCS